MDRGEQLGGSLQLAQLIDTYGEHILCDFQEYYNRSLSDLYRPGSGMSATTALALIKGLPPESRTFTAIAEHDMRWTMTDYLLAAVIDSVNHNTYVFAQAQTKKKLPKPDEVTRPGKAKAKKNKPSQFAFMARQARARAMKKE